MNTPHTTNAPPLAIEALKDTGLPIHPGTLRRYLSAGRIPGAQRIGSRWFCTADQLRAALVRQVPS